MKKFLLASLLVAPLLGGAGIAHAAGGPNSAARGTGTYSPNASCVGWGASQTAHFYPGAVPDALASTGMSTATFIAYLHSLGPNCGLLP